jgi:hypothetical protein
LKKHKPWFDEGGLRVSDERTQDKMQWLHNPNQKNIDNSNNGRRKFVAFSGTKRKNTLKLKLMNLKLTVR